MREGRDDKAADVCFSYISRLDSVSSEDYAVEAYSRRVSLEIFCLLSNTNVSHIAFLRSQDCSHFIRAWSLRNPSHSSRRIHARPRQTNPVARCSRE